MSEWRQTQASDTFREALQATESISRSALAFTDPEQPGPSKVIIRQLNTLLQLVYQLHLKVDKLQEQVDKLNRKEAAAKEIALPSNLIDEISNKLSTLKISEPKSAIIKAPRRTYFFTDPQVILNKERARKS
ncbi:hypothetical protein DMV_gp2 [Dracaena mottle virus]|uniref:Uncharacterized protein n=1 Tax=Dracaena mottle virus TaxID=380669 RepID=Q1KLD4_9VIRU|nr:hypothetical protein DMV_gp2 [Dracaena mottle virus]ABE77343.1 hypothetical protein [Dracaena mottle virus]ABR01169.1 hypothetical protein [Lucky bamboo bacilliform virus]